MSAVSDLARRLARIERTLVARDSTPQLGHSSLEDGAIKEYDAEGNQVSQFGKQFDGTHGVVVLNGPTPPQPSPPTVSTFLGGLRVNWDGTFVDDAIVPMDFSRVEVHVSEDPAFDPDLAETIKGTIETPRGGQVTVPVPHGKTYTVRLVARSTPGKKSTPSEAATGTPGQITGGDIAEGAIDVWQIAQGAITPDRLNLPTHFIH